MGIVKVFKMTEDEAENVISPVMVAPVIMSPAMISPELLPAVKPMDKATLEVEIKKAMAKLGITPELLIQRHKELLNYENPTINLKALELCYKMLGLLKEQVEHSGNIEISAALKSARARVACYGDS